MYKFFYFVNYLIQFEIKTSGKSALCFDRNSVIIKFKCEVNKLTSVFYASVLLLMINCVMTLSKGLLHQ